MRVELPLLSIISLCVLVFFGFQGDVELYSWEVGIDISHDEVRVMVDPVWVIWTDLRLTKDALGQTFGNVSIVKKALRGSALGCEVRNYEVGHVKQYYALGWRIYPLSLIIPIESHGVAAMWLPPPSWINQWCFLNLYYVYNRM